jgi:D-alanine transaminase
MAAQFPQLRNDRSSISTVYLNGAFMHPEEARISPFDRGFIFGDGVYEVIPVFGGRLFRLQHHLQRLRNSLGAIGLPEPLSAADWEDVFRHLVDENGGGDQSLYLQVTRGVAPRNHAFPSDTLPTVFAYAQRMTFPPAGLRGAGVSVITAEDIRWQRCDIKSTSLLAAVLLRQQAVAQGCVETFLIRDGYVTEGAASNVFIIREQQVITPPKGPFILPGITRDLVLELAQRHGIPCRERAVPQDELADADEVWLTSSTQEIKAVTRINGMSVGDGQPGALHARMYSLYQNYKQAVREGKAE